MEATLIKKDGVVRMDKSFDFMCSVLRNGAYKVSITKKVETRSRQQNALLWMWYACIEDETGQNKTDIHDYYKTMFLTRQILVRGQWVNVTGSTTKLTEAAMSVFMEKVKVHAATELGIILPLPEDKNFDEFQQTYKR